MFGRALASALETQTQGQSVALLQIPLRPALPQPVTGLGSAILQLPSIQNRYTFKLQQDFSHQASQLLSKLFLIQLEHFSNQ